MGRDEDDSLVVWWLRGWRLLISVLGSVELAADPQPSSALHPLDGDQSYVSSFSHLEFHPFPLFWILHSYV